MVQRFIRKGFALAVFGICMIGATLPMRSQIKLPNLQNMTESAGTILIGTVSNVRCAVDSRGNTVTYTTFSVEQALRGGGTSSITLTQYGGEVNGKGMYVSHARYFTKGEHVAVMFFPASTLGYTSVVGLDKAVWSIGSDGMIQLKETDLQGLSASFIQKYKLSTKARTSLTTFTSAINELSGSYGTIPTKKSSGKTTQTTKSSRRQTR